MTKELDEKLCAKYPKIFADRDADMRTTAMCWGFSCFDGWYTIIDKLCSNLQWNTDHNSKDYVIENKILRKLIPLLLKIFQKIPGSYNFEKKSFSTLTNIKNYLVSNVSKYRSKLRFIYIESNRYPQVVATQVKEKFGGLCFYVSMASKEQRAVISFVESLSYQICEKCGSMEDVGHTEGWIYTRCRKCAEEDKKCDITSWKSNEERKKENETN